MNKISFKYDEKDVLEFVQELKKDSRLKNYNITEENANLFYQMIESIKHCKECKGLTECPNNIKGYTKEVHNSSLVMKACRYKKEDTLRESQAGLFKTKFLPINVCESTLDKYYTNTLSRKEAYRQANNFITNIDNENEGLYLCGDFGQGKTFLLAAIANELVKKNKRCLLVYFPELVSSLKSALNDGDKFESMIDELKNVDVLMLDDLGSENVSPWLRDEILGVILNYRALANKPICISSNLSMRALMEHFNVEKTNEGKTKAIRILKRISMLVGDQITLSRNDE